MDAAGQYTEHIGIIMRDADEHVVGQDGSVKELEEAVLGGFDRGHVARKAFERWAEGFARLAVNPPIDAV